jgi:RecJ-like exonuclease
MSTVPSVLVNCATCDGKGVMGRKMETCPACDGLGEIKVVKPPTKCPRCDGTGNKAATDSLFFSSGLCPVCGGKGWALIL